VVRSGLEDPFEGTPDEAADALDDLLRDAVALRMQADVPVGAFLSGGIDSSTVVSIMQAVGTSPARTFTIGAEHRYDESTYARAIARHLGTEHTDLVVTPDEAMDVIPRLPHVYDEPFADSSQIPTLLVSALTRRDVTVALSGDGGDELFAGYERYRWLGPLWGRAGRAPIGLRRAASRAIRVVPAGAWDTLAATAQRMRPSTTPPMLGDKIGKVGRVLAANDIDDAYLQLVSHWDPGSLVLGATEPETLWMARAQGWEPSDPTDRMMSTDLVTYLPDDILAKVDRATMSVSLESRVPLLDHRIAAFAWRLPQTYKVRDGQTKWLLRRVLARYVPDTLVDRPKAGFGIPLAGWLRGPLREWTSSLLDPSRLRAEGYLDADQVSRVWHGHRSGRRDDQYLLWDVLMFEAWLDEVAATPRPVRA
jgi:asparagine synthase (glutamine-hydrolysing)